MVFKFILVVLCLTISTSQCANILHMSLLASPSHHIWDSAIFNELARRGHNITVISPFTSNKSPPSVHYIHMDNLSSTVSEYVKHMLNAKEQSNAFLDGFALWELVTFICSNALQSNGFQTLLNYPDNFKFDLIVHDYTLGSCFLPFVHKFNNPPLLAVSAYGHPSTLNDLIGNHHYYAYVPNTYIAMENSDMNFFERFHNFLFYIVEMMVYHFRLAPKLDEMAGKYFGENVPTIRELEKRTALAFVNTNPVLDHLIPLPENVIPVAGVHIKNPKPIPEDLEVFIKSSKKGAIVFSLGSNFRSDFLPKAKRDVFLNVFRALPDYHFLWKFESNFSSSELPNNVQIRAWLPQSDVIAHPNVKAIFFHGGMLTTHEAIWRGIPMVMMPFGLDQRQNLIKTRRLGISEGVDYLSLDEEGVKSALLKVLEDPSYAKNARKWSARFRDQKEKPLERAIWWIEWLIRNPDCDYLKSPVLRLGFIAGNAYDVVACVVLFIIILVFVFIKLLWHCIKICAGKKKSDKHKKVE